MYNALNSDVEPPAVYGAMASRSAGISEVSSYHLHPAVEVDHTCPVARAIRSTNSEAAAGQREVVLHARARVEEQRQAERDALTRPETTVWARCPQRPGIGWRQVGDRLIAVFLDGHVERNDVDAGAKDV